jgi:hypothetical protein
VESRAPEIEDDVEHDCQINEQVRPESPVIGLRGDLKCRSDRQECQHVEQKQDVHLVVEDADTRFRMQDPAPLLALLLGALHLYSVGLFRRREDWWHHHREARSAAGAAGLKAWTRGRRTRREVKNAHRLGPSTSSGF